MIHRLLAIALAVSTASAGAQVTRPKSKAPSPNTAAINAATTVAPTLPADPELRSCNIEHPNAADRSLYLAQRGDAETAKRVARHITKYAVRRFHMEGLITDAQVSAADDRVYSFLKWKLGGPTPVAATWVANGFGHFDKAYVDEAAAVLVGFKIPREGSNTVSFSPETVKLIYGAYPAVSIFLAAAVAGPMNLTNAMFIEGTASTLGLGNSDWLSDLIFDAGAAAAAALANAQLPWPQSFDFPTPTVLWTLRSMRYGERAQRALAWQIASRVAGRQKRAP